MTDLQLRLLRAMPESIPVAPVPGRAFGMRATRVIRRALGMRNPPSAEEVLLGGAPADEATARAAEAWQTIVDMASPWKTPIPLVVGHGNLGTPQDPAADHFYCEVRRSAAGDAALAAHETSGVPVSASNADVSFGGF